MNLDLEDSMRTCTSMQVSEDARPLSFEQKSVKTKKLYDLREIDNRYVL